tara:strand:- start:20599 stop:20871 length:273 start_codon:yes stop_codon:yes gene_type:complete
MINLIEITEGAYIDPASVIYVGLTGYDDEYGHIYWYTGIVIKGKCGINDGWTETISLHINKDSYEDDLQFKQAAYDELEKVVNRIKEANK